MTENGCDIIEMQGVTYTYGKNGPAGIFDICLSIRQGSFVVLAGANGSGKTTLIKQFNGLLIPDAGRVLVDGIPVADDIKRARRIVGMVFQDADSQIVGETVYDDVAFGPENLGWPPKRIAAAVEQVLPLVGLNHLIYKSPHLLSGGEKRRLAIAGVLAMDPKVIVLDEPFANLDYDGVRQVLARIVWLHETGHTIVLSAHDLEKAIAHADRLLVLDHGRLVADGSPLDVIDRVERHGVRKPCSLHYEKRFVSWLT